MLPIDIIDQVRTFKKMSVRELGRVSGVNHGNLSGWLRGIPERLSPGKIDRVLGALGLDPAGFPLPGIHRLEASSQSVSEMDRLEGTVRILVPGGSTVVFLRPDNILERRTQYLYALIPNLRLDLRVVLLIPPMTFKDRLAPLRGLDLRGLGTGSKWLGGSTSDEVSPDFCVTLSPSRLDRIRQDWNLTVEGLDAMTGIPVSENRDWTWKRLGALLESKGIGPEETARKLGLS